MAKPSPKKLIEPIGYLQESVLPLMSLVFIAPILLGYEAGILWLGPAAMRNGAAVWLRNLLEGVGFGQYFLLPITTCAILLAWHHLTHHQWRIYPQTLAGMAVETIAWAFGLVGVARLQSALFHSVTPLMNLAQEGYSAAPLVSYLGAGVYEELLFRLMLLPMLALACRSLGATEKRAWIIATLLSSLFFSAAHYDFITPMGEPFSFYSFLFRFIAGLVFAALFIKRGFGIAAAVHTLYDLMTIAL